MGKLYLGKNFTCALPDVLGMQRNLCEGNLNGFTRRQRIEPFNQKPRCSDDNWMRVRYARFNHGQSDRHDVQQFGRRRAHGQVADI